MRKSSLNLLIFSVISLSAMGQKDVAISLSDSLSYTVIKFENIWGFEDIKPAKFSKQEMEITIQLLKEAIQNYNNNLKADEVAVLPLTQYKIQFIPFLNKNKEKEVGINFLCKVDEDDDWKEDIIFGKKAGSTCYFRLMVYLVTKKYSPLSFGDSYDGKD
jgi:hypothetical protein